MAEARLRDQMGAMALIDEMRHKQMIVQEHLDLPKRREEVARRIREYYRSQNIEVSDELVEQGVRSYFEKRLTYEASPAGALSGLLARIYIARASWKKPAIIGVAALTLLAGGSYIAQQVRETAATQAAARDAAFFENIATQIRETDERFKSMNLAPAEQEQVAALVAAANAAVRERDTARAKESLAGLKSTLAYAETPLTFNVVDRAGAKSGVERNYSASGGKSWYLIAEAVDPSGKVVPVPVTSVESGAKKQATLFGVRVSKDVYESVKEDKMEDGHVDNRMLGKKPANSLTPQFTRAFSAQPDMILEW
ncbi:MAG TPA: DUF6384 family protein [Noviherbaspirillum sp.]